MKKSSSAFSFSCPECGMPVNFTLEFKDNIRCQNCGEKISENDLKDINLNQGADVRLAEQTQDQLLLAQKLLLIPSLLMP